MKLQTLQRTSGPEELEEVVVMTSVNSPACLLARNRFYRDSAPGGPEQNKASSLVRCRRVTLCMAIVPPPGGVTCKRLWVHIVLGSSWSSSLHFSTSKRTRPTDRYVK